MLTEAGGALRSNKVFRGDLKLLAPHSAQCVVVGLTKSRVCGIISL